MAQGHLSHDEFFTKLSALLSSRTQEGHGSVWLTQKRLSHDTLEQPDPVKVADDPLWDTHPPNPLPIIIRATDGKSTIDKESKKKNRDKVRLSTVVQPDDLEAFYTRYAETCKAGMTALKKRDRSKRKKTKKGKGEKK
ncbi:signal recognition particle, SRP14 subunit [Elsinoe ampelina]|uniref:Signal recognition particle subunit SRP14 n=1 Tax=Elsinoe ampelina TaxID=302913 RepID=A0A6A6FZ50_9PEZI|nr:signal recognition particle, SRP14 subunit [Elsinoe ampelina]